MASVDRPAAKPASLVCTALSPLAEQGCSQLLGAGGAELEGVGLPLLHHRGLEVLRREAQMQARPPRRQSWPLGVAHAA
jgi:hypothetical protein